MGSGGWRMCLIEGLEVEKGLEGLEGVGGLEGLERALRVFQWVLKNSQLYEESMKNIYRCAVQLFVFCQ